MNHYCSIFEKLLDATVTHELISFVSMAYASQKMRITLHVSAWKHRQIDYLTEVGFVSRSLSNIHGILWWFWGNFQKSLQFAAGNVWRMCTLIYIMLNSCHWCMAYANASCCTSIRKCLLFLLTNLDYNKHVFVLCD